MTTEQQKAVEDIAKRLRDENRDTRDIRLIKNECQRERINAEYEAYLDGLEDMAKAVKTEMTREQEVTVEREVKAEPEIRFKTRWEIMKQMNIEEVARMMGSQDEEPKWCEGHGCPESQQCRYCIVRWLSEEIEVT